MVNYQNSKVYKIINEKNEIIYIGSTAQKLCQRYQTHNHKSPNHKIILIENYPCNSREELCMREQQIIEEHDNLINQIRAYRSEEQKKEYNKKYHEKYKENNKEYIQQYQKNNYENNKEKIKEHYENNKKEIKQTRKKYRENNRKEINKKQNEKVKCEFCGFQSNKNHLKRHQQTKYCLKFQECLI
tara:strand:+ start:30 stop:587 length:558 start_codon:yes stop_codon:yes gene_type:complete